MLNNDPTSPVITNGLGVCSRGNKCWASNVLAEKNTDDVPDKQSKKVKNEKSRGSTNERIIMLITPKIKDERRTKNKTRPHTKL
jgi:hypothetical protein